MKLDTPKAIIIGSIIIANVQLNFQSLKLILINNFLLGNFIVLFASLKRKGKLFKG